MLSVLPHANHVKYYPFVRLTRAVPMGVPLWVEYAHQRNCQRILGDSSCIGLLPVSIRLRKSFNGYVKSPFEPLCADHCSCVFTPCGYPYAAALVHPCTPCFDSLKP